MKLNILIFSSFLTFIVHNQNLTSNSTINTSSLQNFTNIISPSVKADVKSTYLCPGNITNLKIGDTATLCAHFYSRNLRIAFPIKVDEYSVLSVGGAFNFAAQDSLPSQSFLVQVGDSLTTYPSLFYNKVNKFIVPVFNLVVKLNKGVITSVVWDNDCYSCLTNDMCYSNNVTYFNDTSKTIVDKNCKQNECSLSVDSVFNCDPKFYITWFGTDKDGSQLKSSNLAMSRFRQYAVGSLYNSAKDAFNTTMTTLKNTWEDVKKKTNEIISQFK